jgi:hypothetical protein
MKPFLATAFSLLCLVLFPRAESCPSSTPKDTGGGTVTGASATGGSAWSAERGAESNVKSKLGNESGVVCDICPGGLQCTRTVDLSGPPGSNSETTYSTTNNGNGTYTSSASFTGAYTVNCGNCPHIFPH